MTRARLEAIIYEEVKADVETEADAKGAFQEGYAVGFNDARYRILDAVVRELNLSA